MRPNNKNVIWWKIMTDWQRQALSSSTKFPSNRWSLLGKCHRLSDFLIMGDLRHQWDMLIWVKFWIFFPKMWIVGEILRFFVFLSLFTVGEIFFHQMDTNRTIRTIRTRRTSLRIKLNISSRTKNFMKNEVIFGE